MSVAGFLSVFTLPNKPVSAEYILFCSTHNDFLLLLSYWESGFYYGGLKIQDVSWEIFYKVFRNVRRRGPSCIISSLRTEGRILQNDTVDFTDGPEVWKRNHTVLSNLPVSSPSYNLLPWRGKQSVFLPSNGQSNQISSSTFSDRSRPLMVTIMTTDTGACGRRLTARMFCV